MKSTQRRRTFNAGLAFLAAASLLVLSACADGGVPATTSAAQPSSAPPATSAAPTGSKIRVAYQKTATFTQLDDLMKKAKTEYEAAHQGNTVELVAIEAEQDQYFTKLALMEGSPDTAPDVIYEDTFQVRSDAAAGYLMPIDDYVNAWADWGQFPDNAKKAGAGDDGKIYGVSMGSDTRGLYFRKDIFQKAGLPADWQPKTWDDVLAAARTVKAKVPGVIPFNIYAAKAFGEGTTMQAFEMLLYGTQQQLMDPATNKWLTKSPGYTASMGFIQTVFKEKLGPSIDQALDASLGGKVSTEWLPQGKLAIALDGSWLPGQWITGEHKWPESKDLIGLAMMPTQTGQAPGGVSMSGGWLLSVGAHAKDPQAAFNFISTALNKENSMKYDVEAGQIAVRNDVAADPAYTGANWSFPFFSSLMAVTHFRPATPDYPQISQYIQQGCEAVATGQQTPQQATDAYDQALIGVVGQENTQAAK